MDTLLNCTVAKKCNSCQLNNLSYKEQLHLKENKCRKHLSKFCRINSIIGMDSPFNYRNKAQAVFKRERDKSISWGLYKSSTKSIVKTRSCKLHSSVANEIFCTLCALIKSFKIAPYDMYTGKGFLKSVVIREGRKSGEIMVILNGIDPVFPAKKTFVSALIKKHPDITTVVTTVSKDSKKLFIGKTQDILYGNGKIKDTLLDKTFVISPQSFYQINPVQTETLYSTAIEFASLRGNEVVLDSYCGVGTIGICASDNAKRVLSVESNKDAIIDAKTNAKLNGIQNLDFICADATDYIKELRNSDTKIDVAFVDPPRSGCSKEFLHALCDMKISRIVYISCNVETQDRDIAYLTKHGYTAHKAQPVDMFPHTNHVECVVSLTYNS